MVRQACPEPDEGLTTNGGAAPGENGKAHVKGELQLTQASVPTIIVIAEHGQDPVRCPAANQRSSFSPGNKLGG